jgi:hypothetical protein
MAIIVLTIETGSTGNDNDSVEDIMETGSVRNDHDGAMDTGLGPSGTQLPPLLEELADDDVDANFFFPEQDATGGSSADIGPHSNEVGNAHSSDQPMHQEALGLDTGNIVTGSEDEQQPANRTASASSATGGAPQPMLHQAGAMAMVTT